MCSTAASAAKKNGRLHEPAGQESPLRTAVRSGLFLFLCLGGRVLRSLGADGIDDLAAARGIVHDRHRIVRVGLGQRPGDDLRDVLFLNEVKALRDAHALVHGIDLRDEGLRLLGVSAVGLDAGDLAQARELRIHGLAVVLEDDRQDDRVCQTVRRVVQAAERVRDGVHVADAGAGEGKDSEIQCPKNKSLCTCE